MKPQLIAPRRPWTAWNADRSGRRNCNVNLDDLRGDRPVLSRVTFASPSKRGAYLAILNWTRHVILAFGRVDPNGLRAAGTRHSRSPIGRFRETLTSDSR